MRTVTAEISDGRYGLWAVAVFAGRDLSVTVCGGDEAHIGAVAAGIARPSLADPGKCSASVSVLCIPGHKEDELARQAADRLAARFGCVASVCVGIHVDRAEAADIRRLVQNFSRLIGQLEEKIADSAPACPGRYGQGR